MNSDQLDSCFDDLQHFAQFPRDAESQIAAEVACALISQVEAGPNSPVTSLERVLAALLWEQLTRDQA